MRPNRIQSLTRQRGCRLLRAIPGLIIGLALVSAACGTGADASVEDESISSTEATVRASAPGEAMPESSRPQPVAAVVTATAEPPAAQVPDPASTAVPATRGNEAAPDSRGEAEETTAGAAVPAASPAVTADEGEEPSPADVSNSITVTVDARDDTAWAFFSFTSGTIAGGEFGGSDWDLAFQRTSLLTNSGVTHAGGPGGAVDLGEIGFAEAFVPRDTEFAVDTFEEEGGDEASNAAISDWYVYRFADHTVSPHAQLFAVRTHSGQIAIVKFESYYCADGSAGCITLRFALVAP